MTISLVSLGSTGFRTAKMAMISRRLSELTTEIRDVYRDVSTAHYASARQALNAYDSGCGDPSELRHAIAHLRDAHNVLEAAVRKAKTIKPWFGDEYEQPFLETIVRIECLISIGQLAQMIEALHLMLHEDRPAEQWRITQGRHASFLERIFKTTYFTQYDNKMKQFFQELESIDKNFITEIPGSGYHYTNHQPPEKAVSVKGVSYLRELIFPSGEIAP